MGEYLGENLVNAKRARDCLSSSFIISGYHRNFESESLEFLNHFPRFRSDLVREDDCSDDSLFVMDDEEFRANLIRIEDFSRPFRIDTILLQ